MDQEFVYVVIGGGAAGCALAAILAKKGRTLLLERGPSTVKTPSIRTCCNKDEVTWHRTEGGSWTATANVLGGGSSINAGVFIQESPQSPFFTQAHPFLDSRKVQQAYSEVTQAVSHKRTRETSVGRDLAFAMAEVGLGKHAINTNAAHYGIYHPHSLFNEDGKRHSAVDLLPTEGSAAANLVVKTDILVCRLIFDMASATPRAVGFEYRDLTETGPTVKTFQQPNVRIVVSCGAIHTPRLLLLSGIGNADDLRKHGIPIVMDQPHVGKHLKDKPVIAVSVSSVLPVSETVLDTIAATADSAYTQSNKPQDTGSSSPLTFPVLPEMDNTVTNAAALRLWLNEMHAEGWTYTGTCRFDDVVDRDFSVRGIDNLSIVDASVLKRPTRVNGQATMMMIGTYAGYMLTARE